MSQIFKLVNSSKIQKYFGIITLMTPQVKQITYILKPKIWLN